MLVILRVAKRTENAVSRVAGPGATNDVGLHSLLIVRNGHIVLDAYYFPYDGSQPHDIASATKSLTATAVGLAVSGGDIESVSAPFFPFFPDTGVDAGPELESMTLEHALTMTSGFDCVNDPTEVTLLEMQASDNFVEFALGVPFQSMPGEEWNYCSTVSHLLSGAVQNATGLPMEQYLREGILEPIGVQEYTWLSDPQGVSFGWGDARFFPRDLARIGLLYLRGGRWKEESREQSRSD